MENCHTWIIISKWQNDLHTNTSRSVWPILYGLMIKMLQYKMYPAGELAVLRQLLLYFIVCKSWLLKCLRESTTGSRLLQVWEFSMYEIVNEALVRFSYEFCMYVSYTYEFRRYKKLSEMLPWTPYHTCPKIKKKKLILMSVDVSKIVLDEFQTVLTLIRCRILLHLIWVYTFCSGLSVPILRGMTVIFIGQHSHWGTSNKHPYGGMVGWCEGVLYLTAPGRPINIGLQLGKACYPCSR